jgi:tetratricopeptide (TPR) repeat protein
MRLPYRLPFLVILPLMCLAAFFGGLLVYNMPPVHQRLAWRVDNLRMQIKYKLDPPEQAVFIPAEQVEPLVLAILQSYTPSPTPTPNPTATQANPALAPLPSATPTVTPTPLPDQLRLEGVKYEDQHNRWNYCGPANISMALTYWGWDGNRDVVGRAIKPHDKDKNVMPYEMEYYTNSQVEGISALVRSGGDIDLLQRLVAAGFPVLTEKGYYEYDYNGKLGWMGHYQFVTGFDRLKGVLVVQDTYKDGPNHEVPYDEFIEGWRSFNYIFLITYPPAREGEVLSLLGPWADPQWAIQRSLETARSEVQTLQAIDQFFAAFNVGTAHVGLFQYVDAALAYDYAFSLYAVLPDDGNRPYRMMWYQTGPYWAYYYSARYQDVLNLATNTLEKTISEPVLEESLYWRGMAKIALGDSTGAIQDFRDSLQWHPNFAPSLEGLARLGATP